MRKTISIVSPCYNEEDSLRECYEAVRDMFRNELPGYDYEHVFSDNGSTDTTPEMLRALAAEDPRVRVILNARNFGPFRSMFNALRRTSGDAVITFLPIDLQDPPALVPEFVRLWESGYEIVAGARTTREESWMMRKSRSLFYRTVNRLADFEIPEKVGEFQLIDRKVADAVLSYQDHYPFLRGMIAAVGFRRIVVPYHWAKRERGRSRLNLFMLIDQAINGILSYTSAPMRVCTLVGMAIASLSIFYSVGVGAAWALGLTSAPRGIITLIVSLFFLSGLQFLFIGVMGEYVTSIHKQVRGGPVVVERDAINFAEVEAEPKPAARKSRRG
ncbi:glycosyltransferase family 2 protein [Sphingomonas sp. AOB5]|uniref:glycosyltransferase family 2 protein n=1 Tax=Sphingomonas sp. AOB5 TaxID=3034017 RepID=UPI0023F8F2D0|nr:glycosyltransferase family 2 protein [Sphingomonas sp. AOB5]MDF7774409.1 glycosyltransferase family 2 protein [Sphingomonas sp. AOB5]